MPFYPQLAFRSAFIAALAAALLCGLTMPSLGGCALEEGGEGTVVEILDQETVLLEDGRALRLIGALTPKLTWRGGEVFDTGQRLKTVLRDLVLGQRVEISFGGRKRDRYGHLLAHLHVRRDGGKLWLQGRLIEMGLARAYSFKDNQACMPELLHKEHIARSHGLGFWRIGLFRIRAADDLALLSRLAQSFEIVEGLVQNVSASGGRVFINFGENWRKDFTAAIMPGDKKLFAAAAEGWQNLQGKRVRVRGWIEMRNGPMIALTHPEQLQILGIDPAAQEQGPSQAPPPASTRLSL